MVWVCVWRDSSGLTYQWIDGRMERGLFEEEKEEREVREEGGGGDVLQIVAQQL